MHTALLTHVRYHIKNILNITVLSMKKTFPYRSDESLICDGRLCGS